MTPMGRRPMNLRPARALLLLLLAGLPLWACPREVPA